MNRRTAFFARGTPAAQPRPRMVRATGRTYTPDTADAWKAAVKAAWRQAKEESFSGHLRLNLQFMIPRPKGHLTTRGALTKSAPRHHIGKPDIDNLCKAVMDALTNASAYGDDCQIVELRVGKVWVNELGGCMITLSEID